MRSMIVIVVAVAAAAGLAGEGGAAAACSPGVHPFGTVTARTFCGPARATIVVGGKTIRIAGGGSCERGAAYVAVNIGTVVLGATTRSKPEYFGLVVGKAPMVGGTPARTDGTYVAKALTANHAGKGYAILGATVMLQGNRTRGTFSGTTFGSGTRITGSFSC